MSYPNAYCVKCRSHTPTRDKHTVILQNNARALLGVCPVCASENYKLLPKKKKQEVLKTLNKAEHHAFCFSCKDKVAVSNPQPIVFKNGANALKGHCARCSGEVYRIIALDELPNKPPRSRDQLKSAVIIPPKPGAARKQSVSNLFHKKSAKQMGVKIDAQRSSRAVRTVIPMARTVVSKPVMVTKLSKPPRKIISAENLAKGVLLSSFVAILALIYYRYQLFFGG